MAMLIVEKNASSILNKNEFKELEKDNKVIRIKLVDFVNLS